MTHRSRLPVSALLQVLHRLVNQAVATHAPGADQAQGMTVDLSRIDMGLLRDEFSKVKRKATVMADIRQLVEDRLAPMLARNPLRMNFEKKYQEIIAAYNQDKDRATVEQTFGQVVELISRMDAEQRRAADQNLSEAQLALFDLVKRGDLSKTDRERIKQASRELLDGVLRVIATLDHWTEKEQTQAEVAQLVYQHIWQQSVHYQLSSGGH